MNGFEYQLINASECILNEKIESDIHGFQRSIDLCRIMDQLIIHLKGSKCFTNHSFELNKLTLLTGANASGKSSVVQALLLLKSASESDETNSLLSLEDSRYAFDFGKPDTLINNEWKEDEVSISLSNGVAIGFDGGEQENDRKLLVVIEDLDGLKSVFADGMTYFTAERQGPRYEYALKKGEDNSCGCRGENTGNVISDNWNTKIDGSRLFRSKEGESLFTIALDEWVDYIFPGVTVKVQPAGAQTYQIFIRESYHNFPTEAPNIGFGISYALPILVGALLSKKDGWLIVENPEAHIHAKAQSNMGYFLGMMAATGLRVIVETHSEHVVNGVRRAAIVSERLQAEDVNIYFFKGKSESELITIDEAGNLSDFPVDFFDQSRQDMMEIVNKVRK